jgi:UDPglucose 6-dehydrogenase
LVTVEERRRREQPSLTNVVGNHRADARGEKVRACVPTSTRDAETRKLMPKPETTADPYACIEGADAMVILTEWDQCRALDLAVC